MEEGSYEDSVALMMLMLKARLCSCCGTDNHGKVSLIHNVQNTVVSPNSPVRWATMASRIRRIGPPRAYALQFVICCHPSVREEPEA